MTTVSGFPSCKSRFLPVNTHTYLLTQYLNPLSAQPTNWWRRSDDGPRRSYGVPSPRYIRTAGLEAIHHVYNIHGLGVWVPGLGYLPTVFTNSDGDVPSFRISQRATSSDTGHKYILLLAPHGREKGYECVPHVNPASYVTLRPVRRKFNRELQEELGLAPVQQFYEWPANTMVWPCAEIRRRRLELDWKPTGKRPRGWPRKSWTDTAEEDLKKIGARERRTLVQNREKWREIAIAAKTLREY